MSARRCAGCRSATTSTSGGSWWRAAATAAPSALIAATRDKSIDGVVTLDAGGSPGADLILAAAGARARRAEAAAGRAPERASTSRRRSRRPSISGTGWQGVPDAMRRQADTPWFKSVLTYDPAQVLPKVKQPLLIVHGDLDPNVPPAEADRLAGTARARKKVAAGRSCVHIPDADQKLVSPKVAAAIAEWIKKLDQEADSRMKVGVPRETWPGEHRVALIPSAVAALKKSRPRRGRRAGRRRRGRISFEPPTSRPARRSRRATRCSRPPTSCSRCGPCRPIWPAA